MQPADVVDDRRALRSGLRSGHGRSVLKWSGCVSVVFLAVVLVGGCSPWFPPENGTGVRASGDVDLTPDQPSVAVEFEARLTRLRSDVTTMFAQFHVVTPRDPRDRPGTLPDGFRKELWAGSDWVPYEGSPEVTELGVNTLRVRWVFTLAPGESAATVPFEVEINPSWGDGETVPADGDDYEDLSIEVTATYPLDDS